MLVAKVFETIGGEEEQCVYDKISYCFFRNNTAISETNEFYLKNNLDHKFETHGMFRVVITVRDQQGNIVSDFTSPDVYMKYKAKSSRKDKKHNRVSSSESSESERLQRKEDSSSESEPDLKSKLRKELASIDTKKSKKLTSLRRDEGEESSESEEIVTKKRKNKKVVD